MLRRIINGVDVEGSRGESVTTIGIGDDVVEGDFTVEVVIRGEGVIALVVFCESAVVGRDAINGELGDIGFLIGETV